MSKLLNLLYEAEAELPRLLRDPSIVWKSTDVIYHPPRVQRLQCTWRAPYRLSLHRIWPCAQSEALLHPHPWPQAAIICQGRYEMGIGAGAGNIAPPVTTISVLAPRTSYAMDHPDSWHYVRPLGGPSLSIMLTGLPWNREMPITAEKQPELSAADQLGLLEEFRALYPVY